MTITLPAEIERALTEQARHQNTTPEALALKVLREKFVGSSQRPSFPFEPQDDWERLVLSVGTDCGVALSDEAVSSEGLYD